eukprot:4281893-Prymnesium_polylepis.1
MEGRAAVEEETTREVLSHTKTAKDETLPITAQTRNDTHKTSNHEALTIQTRDTVCTRIWTCAGHVIACGDHDGTR